MKNPFRRRAAAANGTATDDAQAADLAAADGTAAAAPVAAAAQTTPAATATATPATDAAQTTTPSHEPKAQEAAAASAAAQNTAGNPTVPPAGEAVAVGGSRPDRQPYALHMTRWILRAIAFVFEFIAFFIVVGVSAQCAALDPDYCDPYQLIFIGIPMLWNIAEFITLCVNRRGIHPGAHIAADLISAGLLIGPASTAAAIWAYSNYNLTSNCDDTDTVCTGQPGGTRNELPSLYTSIAFMNLAGLIHLVLFILACIAVHKWRRQREAVRLAQLQAIMGVNNRNTMGPMNPMAFGAGMDPNQAYLVTYPDGRQVLVPPSNPMAAQQYHQMSQSHGYYGAGMPQQQPYMQQFPPQAYGYYGAGMPMPPPQPMPAYPPQQPPTAATATSASSPAVAGQTGPTSQTQTRAPQSSQLAVPGTAPAASAPAPAPAPAPATGPSDTHDQASLFRSRSGDAAAAAGGASTTPPHSVSQVSTRSSPRAGEAVPFRNL